MSDTTTVVLTEDSTTVPPTVTVTEVVVGAIAGPPGERGEKGDTGAPGAPGNDGAPGVDGSDGASAYEVAVAEGFSGSEAAWLASLVGPKGDTGNAGPPGSPGNNGSPGETGPDGKSAYEVAVDNGFEGTEEAWLASLVGPPGEDGEDGENGSPGSDGAPGADGASAYEVAVEEGFPGDEAAWLASLVGPKGDPGPPGPFPTRVTLTFESGSLAASASEDIDVELPAAWRVYVVETSRPARVQLYSSAAARTADASRPPGVDPGWNAGVMLDVVTTTDELSLDPLSPLADGVNLDVGDVAARVTNLDDTTGTVEVAVTYVRTE